MKDLAARNLVTLKRELKEAEAPRYAKTLYQHQSSQSSVEQMNLWTPDSSCTMQACDHHATLPPSTQNAKSPVSYMK